MLCSVCLCSVIGIPRLLNFGVDCLSIVCVWWFWIIIICVCDLLCLCFSLMFG